METVTCAPNIDLTMVFSVIGCIGTLLTIWKIIHDYRKSRFSVDVVIHYCYKVKPDFFCVCMTVVNNSDSPLVIHDVVLSQNDVVVNCDKVSQLVMTRSNSNSQITDRYFSAMLPLSAGRSSQITRFIIFDAPQARNIDLGKPVSLQILCDHGHRYKMSNVLLPLDTPTGKLRHPDPEVFR